MKFNFFRKDKPKEDRRRIKANDPIYNSKFVYANNAVSTSKYNIITFLPKNLFEQFQRLANAYFLILLILQVLPKISSLNPITTILPLSCVLILKALKDFIDDVQRHRNDNLVNSRPTLVLRGKSLKKEKWCQINVGDIIKLQNDDFVAADLLLLASSEPHGLCYIETAELDGETNLKVRQALPDISKRFEAVSSDSNAINHEMSKLDFAIECEAPNQLLNEFEGTLKWRHNETYSLDNDKMLLRGCRLRNTRWCYGLVVFAGSDTKLMMNGGKTKFKQTHIDKLLNYLIIGIVIFLFSMCAICTIACGIWEAYRGYDFQVYLPWESFVVQDRHSGAAIISLLVFLSYLIILNTVVPISLYVSVEFIRSIQSLWINWDIKMYYEKADIPAKARTTTLNEELGQIEYIFSDKTGTLTQNIMTFNKCSINGTLYGYIYDSDDNEIEINDNTKAIDLSGNPFYEKSFKFYDQSLLDAINKKDEHCYRFFTLLCVCHTVMSEIKDGDLQYQAQSPDEAALVSAARNLGFVFIGRTPKTITVRITGEEKTYDVLNILDFNNVRKRMSVICRIDGKIILFCKGADTIIKERLRPDEMEKFATSEDHLNKFAEDALRTLCLAWKEIPEDEYKTWAEEHHEASISFDNRAERVSEVYEKIERNLLLVGSSAIEDKLQDGVPECIATLAKANIKIWVLTGDKQETAINIGYSCQLLTSDMDVYTIESNSEIELIKEIDEKKRLVEDSLKRQAYQNEKSDLQNNLFKSQENAFNRFYSPGSNSKSYPLNVRNFTNLEAKHEKNLSDINETFGGNALVINGQALVYALTPNCEKDFLDLACLCKAVICCRVTPGQKKAVVDLVKTHKKAITLAVGDGANDVSMIKSAHIGVGISGQEGQQAVLASDFSIGQFRFLERLLLVHGRWSYYRISKFLRYFFYKNFASTLCHFWFAFFCGFSAQTLFDPFFISTYNVFFSSLPVLALGVFDQDVDEELSVKYPSLYLPGQKGTLFNRKEFLFSVMHGIVSSLVLFFIPYGTMYLSVNDEGKDAADLQSFGFAIATVLVIVVNLQCGLDTSYWTGFNHFCIWGTLIVHFLFHFALYSEFIFKLFGIGWYYIGTSQAVCSTAVFWFTVLLTSAILLLPIIAYRFVRLDTTPSLADKVRIVQKYGTKTPKAKSNIFRTRPRLSMRASSRSMKRSAYAFSHEEGFAALIREGKMMSEPIASRANNTKAKLTSYSKSRRDVLDTELADNIDRNADIKLTKLVYNQNV